MNNPEAVSELNQKATDYTSFDATYGFLGQLQWRQNGNRYMAEYIIPDNEDGNARLHGVKGWFAQQHIKPILCNFDLTADKPELLIWLSEFQVEELSGLYGIKFIIINSPSNPMSR